MERFLQKHPKLDPPTWKTLVDTNGGDVQIMKHFIDHKEAQELFSELMEEIDWKQERIVIYGKECFPTRETDVCGDKGLRYKYSGITQEAKGWYPTLEKLKKRIEEATSQSYNFVLCNLYKDGNSSIGYHSDDERDLVPNSVIASLSLGEPRDFLLKHKTIPDMTKSVILASGDLLTMKGTTQSFWKHSIPARKKVKDPRINLTFRKCVV